MSGSLASVVSSEVSRPEDSASMMAVDGGGGDAWKSYFSGEMGGKKGGEKEGEKGGEKARRFGLDDGDSCGGL